MKYSLTAICLLFLLSQCPQVVHSLTSVTKVNDTIVPGAHHFMGNDRRALLAVNATYGNSNQASLNANGASTLNAGAAVTTAVSDSSDKTPIMTIDSTTTSNSPNPTASSSTANPTEAPLTSNSATTASQSSTTTDSTLSTSTTSSEQSSTTKSTTRSSSTRSSSDSTDSSSTTSDTASTAAPSSTDMPSQTPVSYANKSNTGAIAGGVVGGVVGAALIGGLIGFLFRRKKQDKKDYTIDMNQNDFNSASAPLPPFDSRRYVPSPQPAYTTGPLPSEPSNDYNSGYSPVGYGQGAYGQDGYHGYGYYEYPQQQEYYNNQSYPQSQIDPTSPTTAAGTTAAGTMTEGSFPFTANKPDLKEYNKPDES